MRLHKTSFDFMWKVEKNEFGSAHSDDSVDKWFETHKFMTEQVPPILALLEDDLRKILGTHEDESGDVSHPFRKH